MLKNIYFQWCVWGIGVILLAFFNWGIYNVINERITLQNYQIFLDITNEAELDIKNKILFYEEILWGGVGLFNASNEVERSEWEAYSRALELERYPGINGVGYIESVEKKKLNQFLRQARKEYPGYKRKTAGSLKAKDAFMILYIEPENINIEAIGLDIGSEQNRRRAAQRARDTGRAMMTDPITLVQDKEQTPGFLILLPVYEKDAEDLKTVPGRRDGFYGWVYAPIIAHNFLQNILHTSDYLGFSVTSGGASPTYIYQSDENGKESAQFRARSRLTLAGAEWDIEWWSKPGLTSRLSSYTLSRVTGVLTLIITLFVAFISGFLLYREQKSRFRAKEFQSSFEESELKFAEAFENAAIGIALVSLEGTFVKVNRSLCDMLGYSSEELIEKTFQDITHPDDLEADLAYVYQVLDGRIKTYTMEKRYFHKKGQTVWIRLNVSLVRDPEQNPKFFVSQIEDITRTKLLDDIKSDFVSITSHQFRTPLSGMRWNIESLLDGGMKDYALPKIKIILSDVLDSILRMNELVKDLLRVSKLESGLIKADLVEVDMKKSVRRCIKELKIFAEKRNQKLVFRRTAESVLAEADQGFVDEVLKVLIHNAINYAPEKSSITIEFELRKRYFYLYVDNDGLPIPRKEQKRLFEKFSRLQHGVQRNPNGSGLGLFIARNLTEIMGGSLNYAPEQKDRVRFTLKLLRRNA